MPRFADDAATLMLPPCLIFSLRQPLPLIHAMLDYAFADIFVRRSRFSMFHAMLTSRHAATPFY